MSQTNEPTGLEIAVVGMAGRFPGAPGVDALWANLCAGEAKGLCYNPASSAGTPGRPECCAAGIRRKKTATDRS